MINAYVKAITCQIVQQSTDEIKELATVTLQSKRQRTQ